MVGVDGSSAMLRQAEKTARDLDSVELVRSNFSDPGCRLSLQERIRKDRPAAFLFTLGLICLEDWPGFFTTVFDAAGPGARFSIMDVYSDRRTLGARFMNLIGAADCTRPVWRELERRAPAFAQEQFKPFRVLGLSVLVSRGAKEQEPTADRLSL